jgi:uncharacterized protein (TIGR03083 family)
MDEDAYGQTIEALADESARAETVLRSLADEDFELPTRCEAWDVRALVGHLIRDVDRLVTYAAEPAPAAADMDAVAYFVYDAAAEAPRIARSTQETADRYGTNAELVAGFAKMWREAVLVARREGPDRIVAVGRQPPQALRMDEYAQTRVLEMVVHGLDLARAVKQKAWLTPGGARITIAILAGLLGGPPPEALAWDDVTFIEAGTGRRRLSDGERTALGSDASSFPLLA